MNDTTPEPITGAGPHPEEVDHQTPNTKNSPQPAEPNDVPIPRLSRIKRFLLSTFRWMGVALLGLLVGLVVMAYPVLHAQANLKTVEKERDQARFNLAMQTTLLDSLKIDQSRLVILRALSEVRAAKLALDGNDEINMPLFIDKATQVMKNVPDTLMRTQQTTVTKIQQKLTLAQEKAKSNIQVAKPDLDQLLSDLIENLRNLDALLNPNP